MKQYQVLQYGYSRLLQLLTDRGKDTTLFSVCDGGNVPELAIGDIVVLINISDICQFQIDKTGQRIIVDEMLFDLPALVVCTVGIHIYAKQYASALEAAGSIIAFLKDTSVIPLESYNWHGNTTDKLYIEPVIREACVGQVQSAIPAAVHLQYKFEAGINSENGSQFKRVEKREIRSDIKDENKNKQKED